MLYYTTSLQKLSSHLSHDRVAKTQIQAITSQDYTTNQIQTYEKEWKLQIQLERDTRIATKLDKPYGTNGKRMPFTSGTAQQTKRPTGFGTTKMTKDQNYLGKP
jgi:hypothetical protein